MLGNDTSSSPFYVKVVAKIDLYTAQGNPFFFLVVLSTQNYLAISRLRVTSVQVLQYPLTGNLILALLL